jgi:carbon-monoxide dehydrogenase medium subunit
MQDFFYHKPISLEAAANIIDGLEDGIFIAGGQTILPVMKFGLAQPTDLVDLKAIEELKNIEITDSMVSIGAMCTHAKVASSKEIREILPGLTSLANQIGDVQVRNRGTIGGSLANNDPSADYPAAVLALDAKIITNKRKISADDFFIDMFETALDEGEIIIRVDFPFADLSAYTKFPNPASRYAIVGVFVSKTPHKVRLAITGAGPMVFRSFKMEEALCKDFSANAIKDIFIAAEDLNNDIHASEEYRAHLIHIMAKRAIDIAINKEVAR